MRLSVMSAPSIIMLIAVMFSNKPAALRACIEEGQIPATKRPGAKIFSGSKAFLTRRIKAASFFVGPQIFTMRFKAVGQKRMDAEPLCAAAYSNTAAAMCASESILLSFKSSGRRAKYSGPDEFAKIQHGTENRSATERKFMTSGEKTGKALILKMVAAGAE